MKKISLFLLLSFNLIVHAQNLIYDSLSSGGIMRKYILYVPAAYNSASAVPLVFNLHGYGSNATQQMQYTGFTGIADTANFLLVYPEGTLSNGAQYWNAGFGGAANDVAFISDLIDKVSTNYNVDLNRVYSCGMSNGGIMSYYLALYLPSRITAIASVTGSMLNAWFSQTPVVTRPFPVMQIHGTADATVPYNGSNTFAHIDSVVKKWAVYNGCQSSPSSYPVPNSNFSDNSTATRFVYSGGNGGSSVELFRVYNGSHSWPGAPPFIANTNQDFKASFEIWRFFRQYSLQQFLPASVNEYLSSSSPSLYPNPFFSQIHIRDVSPEAEISLTDLNGRFLKPLAVGSNSIEELEPGLYFVRIVDKERCSVFRLVRGAE
jgi:polyhydroxybutyrate depolymerase